MKLLRDTIANRNEIDDIFEETIYSTYPTIEWGGRRQLLYSRGVSQQVCCGWRYVDNRPPNRDDHFESCPDRSNEIYGTIYIGGEGRG